MHVYATLTSDPNSPGSTSSNVALAAGSALAADVGTQYRPSNVGAATISKVASAATTNATSVKGSAGRVIGWVFCNTSAAFKFVRFYNKATAPVVGTDSPAIIVGVPPNSTIIKTTEGGSGYSLGIAYAITNLVADLDATVVAANDVVGAIYYA